MRLKDNRVGSPADEEKKRSFRYTVLSVVCVCVVLLGAVFAMRAYPQWMGRDWDNRIDLTEDENRVIERGKVVVKQVPTVDSKVGPKDSSGTKPESEAKTGILEKPVRGDIINPFSKEVPIYSKTLDQYTVHPGIDIACGKDEPVCAAKSGTVTRVANDDKLGIVIELTHADGLITRYGNLSTSKMVEEGDVVKTGAVISGVGSSALFESLDAPHLHFEVLKDGESVDPGSYLQ